MKPEGKWDDNKHVGLAPAPILEPAATAQQAPIATATRGPPPKSIVTAAPLAVVGSLNYTVEQEKRDAISAAEATTCVNCTGPVKEKKRWPRTKTRMLVIAFFTVAARSFSRA